MIIGGLTLGRSIHFALMNKFHQHTISDNKQRLRRRKLKRHLQQNLSLLGQTAIPGGVFLLLWTWNNHSAERALMVRILFPIHT